MEEVKAEGGITFAQDPGDGQIRRNAAQRHRFGVCGLHSCAQGYGEGDSLHDYAIYLKEHSEEGEKLFDDVLIPVTSFFRDFEAFEALKTQVYPAIVKDKGNKGTIRMWAPGCSTGE